MFIFVNSKSMGMESFVAAIMIMMSLSVATFQVIRILKYKELAERRHRLLSMILYVDSVLILCDLLAGGEGLLFRWVVDVLLALIPLMLLSSSIWSVSGCIPWVRVVVMVMSMLAMYHLLCAFTLAEYLDPDVYKWCIPGLALWFVSLFLLGVWYRMREVKAVLQSGTVWASVSFVVDAIYVVFVLVEVIIILTLGERLQGVLCLFAILLSATAAAYGIRMACDSLFVLSRRHERRIVESMKISPVEMTGIGTREDDLFKDIYARVQEYFEQEKPYLNGDLTINDIVSVVYTNKLYISRAISQCTGRNFCQFVNYHRVMYSVECFRKNPDLKVAELWPMCGFNTIVSFNMAFRLFMGENPSDWCRKEKIRIFRKGK